jgi:hypothetical protein
MEHVCDRCSDLATDKIPSFLGLSQPRIVAGELSRSSCRVCRFIASAVPLNHDPRQTHIISPGGKGFYPLKTDVIGSLRLTPAIHDGEGGRNTGKMIIVISAQSKQLSEVLKYVRPSRVDTSVIIGWMRNCQDLRPRHQKCKTKDRSTLQAFRAIDCITRHVVSAPTDCQFVALSYVWGQVLETAHGDTSKLPPNATVLWKTAWCLHWN